MGIEIVPSIRKCNRRSLVIIDRKIAAATAENRAILVHSWPASSKKLRRTSTQTHLGDLGGGRDFVGEMGLAKVNMLDRSDSEDIFF